MARKTRDPRNPGRRPVVRRPCLEPLERRALLSLTIAQENTLPGTPASTWDVSGSGDTTIQGFATDISANEGQTISFKINDTKSAPYHIDIYRVGYYQGNGARLVATIPSTQTQRQVQPAPLKDLTTGLVDCGNWSVSASWVVPADATSGVYFARPTRDDTGGATKILFIVRNDQSHSDIQFQTSDTTWQAYNTWGGTSLYQGGTLPSGGGTKVSYNRPITLEDTSGGYGTYNSFWHAEYPMVRWLEANGYDISYSTDVDSARNGNLIPNHKIFMSVGHDEYWSGQQRANVMAARDAGVSLAFFSGNESFWKVRWENSTDASGTPYRTLVCYKESKNGSIDPLDKAPTYTWTGTWRDNRGGSPDDAGVPENAMSGTAYMNDRTSADLGISMNVPAAYANLRFWRNTSVARLTAGQTATLGQYVVGYETDEDLNNPFRPGGLFDMSATTFSTSSHVVDQSGTVVGVGTSTHSLTLYRAPSGALVFGAGTVQWSWGLDGNHIDGTSTPDPAMQQATVNLLADMNAQPATLQAELVAATASTDKTAPTSTITSPAAGASILSGTTVTITGTATDAGGGVVAAVEVSTDGGATWHPAVGRTTWSYTWTPNGLSTVTLKSRAVDDSGNIETPSSGVAVSVAGPISIWSATSAPLTAADGDTSSTEVGVKFRSDVAAYILGLRFYKGTGNTGTHVGSLWTGTGTLLAQATFANETATGWQQVNFASPVAIAANTTYVASYHAPVGHYAEDDNYFVTSGADSAPLHALANGVDGPNGVYVYGASVAFPTNTYNSANYWVDVVFSLNVWMQTTAADFNAGSNSGTAVTNTSGGEVRLAPSFSDDFNGSALSSSWTSTAWPKATLKVTVSGGLLSVSGGQVRSVQSVPAGVPVEGWVTLAAATNQKFGLATDMSASAGNSWAIFTTNNTTGTCYAEVNSAGSVSTVSLGARPSGYHLYRVQPTATGFQFYIDGVLKTTISKTIASGTALKIDLASATTTALMADWVRQASYPSSGTYTSSTLDAGRIATWGALTWTASLPPGTTLVIETSSSTDGVNWSNWSATSNGGVITSPAARYLRYRVTFQTTDPTLTAILYDISFTWN
jgi:hypothetical protein